MSRKKGDLFEKKAAEYLSQKSYSILERNWYAGTQGEIDLICLKDEVLVFVEVKGRNSKNWIKDGLESITAKKAKCLLHSINSYLDQSQLNYQSVRFDLIVLNQERVEHFENISLDVF